jgi:hypothetical protein
MQPVQAVSPATVLAILLLGQGACNRGPAQDPADRTPAVPQISGPDMVPKELVTALLVRFSGGRTVPEIVVGRLPANMPFEVPSPDSARAVGSLAYSPSGGTVVFSVPHRPIDAVRAYEDMLQRAGWRAEKNSPSGGFRQADVVYTGRFCQGDRHSLNASTVERQQGGSFLQVHYTAHPRGSPCDDPNRSGFSPHRGPMPTLYPPDRTTMVDGGGSGGGRGYSDAHARLKTELSPAQLVAHYSTQVRRQGWSLQSESATPDMTAQTWRMEDRDGKVWVGLLLAQSIPETDGRSVLFRVMPQTLDRQ